MIGFPLFRSCCNIEWALNCRPLAWHKRLYNWVTLALTIGYVARTWQHWNGRDTWTRDKFFKIHMTHVSDTFQTWHSFTIEVSVLHKTTGSSLWDSFALTIEVTTWDRVVSFFFAVDRVVSWLGFILNPLQLLSRLVLLDFGPSTRCTSPSTQSCVHVPCRCAWISLTGRE